MELEFHKKRHCRPPWNTAIGKTLFKKNCMKLEFMELGFNKKRYYRYLKCHYKASYGVIRLKKKTCMLKRHYRALKNCMELEFMELEFQFFFFFFLVCYNSIVQKLSFKIGTFP